jgi:hypothetical protein
MKYIVASLIVIAWAQTTVVAQVEPKKTAEELQKIAALTPDTLAWKRKTTFGAGFSSVTLSNWAGGGQNSITIRGLILGSADYAHEDFSWDNDLDLGYSLTQVGDQPFRKNDDRFIVTSKASMRQSEGLRYTALLDFRSQLAVGYNYDQRDPQDSSAFLKISNLFSPAYVTTALGAEWTPAPQFRMLVSPLSARSIIVLDQALADSGAYGVERGRNTKLDMGMLINATIDWEVFQNVNWKSRLNAFMRYDAPRLWVVTVENTVMMKVNSWLSIGLLTDLFYDHRVPVVRDNGSTGPATQLRNQLVMNIAYTLSNH